MKRESAWKKYDETQAAEVEALAQDYRAFISANKTERECAASAVALAEAAGYRSLDELVAAGTPLKAGDKVWAQAQGKATIFVHLGTEPLEKGFAILGAHIDSPRLDLKQNPLYESSDFVLLDTHYYGGIKKYQWTAIPLALHGVVAKTDGTVVQVAIGEDADDPVFCVTDILPHLGYDQMKKEASKIIEGEDLDVLVGNRPLVADAVEAEEDAEEEGAGKHAGVAALFASGAGAGAGASAQDAEPEESGKHANAAADVQDKEPQDAAADEPEKEPFKAYILQLLAEKYGFEEDDFLSAELEVVPAGPARDMGFDRSMILGYGQDDRVCAYPSLRAQLALEAPKRTAVCILVDKEEIGSVGATGMESLFFENTMAEIMELAGEGGLLQARRALTASSMLSSDVNAGFDPLYASVFEKRNASFLGYGLVFCKYTGARGKSGSNDASAEYMARIRRIMQDADVSIQTAELGKVDAGGGGTIAFIPARYGMDVIDAGVAVLNMHAPWEVSSKADIYETYRGYLAFLQNA